MGSLYPDLKTNLKYCMVTTSTTPFDPCAHISFVIKLPKFECTGDILGNPGSLSDFGRGIGSIPGQLSAMVNCLEKDIAAQISGIIEKINKVYEQIKSLTSTVHRFTNLHSSEHEMEQNLIALWNEFKLYIQTAVINILKKIPGLEFLIDLLKVPIPFLHGVTLLDTFTPEGRQKIMNAITTQIDSVAKALGMPWSFAFGDSSLLSNPEMRLQAIANRIWHEVEKGLSDVITAAWKKIVSLTGPIKAIWDSLHLPTMPSLTWFDFENLFATFWNSLEKLGLSIAERMQKTIDYFLNFDIGSFLHQFFGPIPWPFKTKIKDLLNLTGRQWNLQSPSIDFATVMEAVHGIMSKAINLMWELWFQLTRPFFDAIKHLLPGITDLLALIPLTFCEFIHLAAAPILLVETTIQKLIPSGINVATV